MEVVPVVVVCVVVVDVVVDVAVETLELEDVEDTVVVTQVRSVVGMKHWRFLQACFRIPCFPAISLWCRRQVISKTNPLHMCFSISYAVHPRDCEHLCSQRLESPLPMRSDR